MQDPNEDTEWNDVLRDFKILPPRPKSPTEELEQAMEEAVSKAYDNRLEGKDLDELDMLDEEGLEDEDFIQSYREKRMAEIRAQASKERFGQVYKINKSEYTQEITEASASCDVVVHISSQQSTQSRLLEGLLLRVAPKYREIKFVEIPCTQISDKYPTSQTPTLLVYKNKEVAYQLVTLALIGGNSTNLVDMDKFLVNAKLVQRTDPRLIENQDEEYSD